MIYDLLAYESFREGHTAPNGNVDFGLDISLWRSGFLSWAWVLMFHLANDYSRDF